MAGRPKGSANRTNKHIKELCSGFDEQIVARLSRIALNSPNEANAIAAARELLDRAHGKPRQAMEHSGPDGDALKFPTFIFTPISTDG